MAGKAGKGPAHKSRLIFGSSEIRKFERGPDDTDDSCCFTVYVGDHVSVKMNRSDKFTIGYVVSIRERETFKVKYLDPEGIMTTSVFYDEFNVYWKFGWDAPRTRSGRDHQNRFFDYIVDDVVYTERIPFFLD